MSFKEWLYDELLTAGTIDEDFDEDFTFDQLNSETDLTEDEYEQYKHEFEEHCEMISQTPIWDVD